MEKNIKVKQIINDNELARNKSINFFKKIKERPLFCKEIEVSSVINKTNNISFKFENVWLDDEDIKIKENNIQVDLFDKFAFFISNDCTNFNYIIEVIDDNTMLMMRYSINDIIKNIIYISF